jgi:hypothetical protein
MPDQPGPGGPSNCLARHDAGINSKEANEDRKSNVAYTQENLTIKDELNSLVPESGKGREAPKYACDCEKSQSFWTVDAITGQPEEGSNQKAADKIH